MKRFLSPFAILFLAVFLLASCGDSEQDNDTTNNDVSEEQENANTNNTNSSEGDTADMDNNGSDNEQAEMKEQMNELDMKEFELEVEYEDNKEYEAEVEFNNDQYTAELDDELTGVQMKGKEAFDEIYPMLQELNIAHDAEKDATISDTLEAFELNDDYVKFELEVTFNDDTEIEFEDQ